MDIVKDIRQGDVLAFISGDGKYKALLCTSTVEESPMNFTFAALSVDQSDLPTLSDIRNSQFYGIGNRKDDFFKYSKDELDNMWKIHPEVKPYYLGSYGLTVWRKDFVKFSDNFKLVGKVDVVNNLDKHGNGGMNASDWDFLRDFFNGKFKQFLQDRGQKLFELKAVVK